MSIPIAALPPAIPHLDRTSGPRCPLYPWIFLSLGGPCIVEVYVCTLGREAHGNAPLQYQGYRYLHLSSRVTRKRNVG